MNFRIETIELADAEGRPRSLTDQQPSTHSLEAGDAEQAVRQYATLVGGDLVGECSAMNLQAATATLRIGRRIVSVQALGDVDSNI